MRVLCVFWHIKPNNFICCHLRSWENFLNKSSKQVSIILFLRWKLPLLHSHLAALGVEWGLVGAKWFICLYADVMPVEVQFSVCLSDCLSVPLSFCLFLSITISLTHSLSLSYSLILFYLIFFVFHLIFILSYPKSPHQYL